jgi:transcriptional regulator with XRE-family HTH domain
MASTVESDGPTMSVTQVMVAQLKRVRRRRDVTVVDLAARCAHLGAVEITQNVLHNIEAGRRTVTLDQLAALALALDVAPVHLLTSPPDGRPVQVTPQARASSTTWDTWVHGKAPLPHQDERAFWAYRLEHTDPDDSGALIEMARARTTTATMKVATQIREDAANHLTHLAHLAHRALDDIDHATTTGNPTDITAALQRARTAITHATTTTAT